jgi:hypothetical protein
MLARTNYFRQSVLNKYQQRISRLRKAVQGGKFSRYTADKKRMLLLSLSKYERQLAHWGIACASGVALLLPVHPVLAQTPMPVGSEFRVNSYTTIDQKTPAVAIDSDGDFVVTWESQGQDGSSYGIYAQRYNNNGAAQGAEIRVNAYTTSNQRNSAVAMDNDGDFVVTWMSSSQDGSNYGIYAQRYNNNGVAQGAEFRVNTFTTNNQRNPSVAMDSNGNFVVAWGSNGQDGSAYGIYAQRYDNTGATAGTEFKVNTYTTSGQTLPSVVMDSDGDFVISWVSNGQDGSSQGIYAQRYNNTGTAQGGEFRMNTYTTGVQSELSVAMDSGGNFVAIWASLDAGSKDIYARRYDNTGTAQGGEFLVNTYTTNYQESPSVALDGNGDFIVSWASPGQDGSYSGIYAQRYDNTGTAQGSEFRVNAYTTNYQALPSVAMDNDGDFVVTWQSIGQDGSYSGIYAQRYTLPPLLPVELLYFTGQAGATANVLEWATATEKNTAWQIVERSVNGVEEWTEIGRVTGAGNSTTPNYYTIIDKNQLPKAYYRLIAEDFDGSRQYTDIISLQRPGTELAILQVFPQPAGDEVRLDIYAPVSGIVTISVTDLLGREVLAREYTLDRGNHQLVLDMHGLPTGRYQVVICDGDQRVTKAVVK